MCSIETYVVFLTQGSGGQQESFVYITSSDHRQNQSSSDIPGRTLSWTSFAFTEKPVKVEVLAQNDFNACLVRPTRYRIGCIRSGPKRATFTVASNASMMSVEFDNDQTGPDKDITDKLLVFADAPESSVPSKDDPSVLYYDVGMHDLNGQLAIPEGVKEVYLAPGAYVEGGFITTASHPVTIHGRGVLDTRQYVWHDTRFRWAIINMDQGSDHIIEGITLVDSMQFFIRALSDHVTISNVKTVGAWVYNNDGISVGFGSVVRDSFIHANDDSIKLYASNVEVTRCVVWQAQNGAVFQFGWWPTRTVQRVLVTSVDVIHTDWCTFKGKNCHISPNNAVVDLAGNTTLLQVSDLEFRDVRVEGFCPRIFNFKMAPLATGTVSDVMFSDWNVESQSAANSSLHNEISGVGEKGRIENWHFVSFVVGRLCVFDPSNANFDIDPNTTSNVNFLCPKLVGDSD
nr:hypothetical protein BaRGS_028907 [Batillaria attramentaria]